MKPSRFLILDGALTCRLLGREDADESGWNGQPGRSRRQLAAELWQENPANPLMAARRIESGGRVARRNGPVARSTNPEMHRSTLGIALTEKF